ncbi:13136_t:CDS:10 [Entrophospora sp. SA101]|nr:13136_t:CDS:10 [Entrophospora sp. SA101]
MSKKQILPSVLKKRVIIHIDMDCFYCQVEQVRLGIPSTLPVAVRQWNALIAVNYAAREAGIKKVSNIQDALKICPGLKLVHVATYANGDPEPKYYPNPSYGTHKASLDVYRNASLRIFKIFMRYCNMVQRASVDEAYLDVTNIVNQRIVERYPNLLLPENLEDGEQVPPILDWNGLGVLYRSQINNDIENNNNNPIEYLDEIYSNGNNENINNDNINNSNNSNNNEQKSGLDQFSYNDESKGWDDMQLYIAAEISKEVRETIFNELGYTSSAGIAHNMTLAKLCSALNKPNMQTVIRSSQTLGFMRNLPFQKIRKLGGKLGAEVGNILGIETAGELWGYSVSELQAKFGMAYGIWLYNICRGVDSEEVVQRNISKSMMAAKSFKPPLKSLSQVVHWCNILSSELYKRLLDDYEINNRWPKTLTIQYKCINDSTSHSKSCTFPIRSEVDSPDLISKRLYGLLGNSDNLFPCSRLSASAIVNQELLINQPFVINSSAATLNGSSDSQIISENAQSSLPSTNNINLRESSTPNLKTTRLLNMKPATTTGLRSSSSTSKSKLKSSFKKNSRIPSSPSNNTILQFFTKLDPNLFIRCEKCYRPISNDKLAEHLENCSNESNNNLRKRNKDIRNYFQLENKS